VDSTQLHVLAGVLCDREGRVLLAERPAGKHLAGMWEFPGGKREPGEAPLEALARELDEELGIALVEAAPLIRVPWRYHERALLLDAWRVTQWRGEPRSLEGQGLQWSLPARADPATLAPADRAILQALRLPPHYLITPADVPLQERDTWFERIVHAIQSGERLLQLRLPLWPHAAVREFAAALLPLAREHGAQLLLNADVEGALALDMGVHLTGAQLAARRRQLPRCRATGKGSATGRGLRHAVSRDGNRQPSGRHAAGLGRFPDAGRSRRYAGLCLGWHVASAAGAGARGRCAGRGGDSRLLAYASASCSDLSNWNSSRYARGGLFGVVFSMRA
jgi:8-oxo-dGTP diphosphatase